jgi:LysM repeat protein
MNNRLSSIIAVLCYALILAALHAANLDTPPSDLVLPIASSPERTTSYTVHTGDTLGYLSHKFGTSVAALKKLNHLKKNHLKAGLVLQVPAGNKNALASLGRKTKKETLHAGRRAQPVQDFDLPASTFASCPVPVPSDVAETPPVYSSPAPALGKPAGTYLAPAPPADSATMPNTSLYRSRHFAQNAAPPESPSRFSYAPPAPKPAHHGLFNFFYTPPPASPDWGARFTEIARELASRGLEYDEDWCPPGESHSWSMDCSNTTRYLYKAATGIQLPRTASDQYYYLHLQNKAWDVPQLASGFADCNYLRQNLKAGDLLFWENTYRPERQPPITHVMIFLGTNGRGEWIMAGSQSSRGGEHNRRHGGPDIYVFNPERPCGGYTTWLGLVHHQGRFCAFGRPLEADKSKLAVAAND